MLVFIIKALTMTNRYFYDIENILESGMPFCLFNCEKVIWWDIYFKRFDVYHLNIQHKICFQFKWVHLFHLICFEQEYCEYYIWYVKQGVPSKESSLNHQ